MSKPSHNTLFLCSYAIEKLKACGFERAGVSLKSEATYWRLLGRDGVLRVSTHKHNGRSYGLDRIAASLTFRGNVFDATNTLKCDVDKIESRIAHAVGAYILNTKLAVSA
jgi:hypothetical protein